MKISLVVLTALPSNTYTYTFSSNIQIDDLSSKSVSVEVKVPQWKINQATEAIASMIMAIIFGYLAKIALMSGVFPWNLAVFTALFAMKVTCWMAADVAWHNAFGEPDPNFTEIPTPRVIILPEVQNLPNITWAKDAAITASHFAAYSVAASIATARAEGAMLADQPKWASKQLEAASNYKSQAAAYMQILRKQLNNTMSEFDVAGIKLNETIIQKVKDDLASSFTQAELNMFNAYNFTELEISSILNATRNMPEGYLLDDYLQKMPLPKNLTMLYVKDAEMLSNEKIRIEVDKLGYQVLPISSEELEQLDVLKSEIEAGLAKGFYNTTIAMLLDQMSARVQELIQQTHNATLLSYQNFILEARNRLLGLPLPPLDELLVLKSTIMGLPDFVFRQPKLATKMKAALSHKIGEVIIKIQTGNYNDAINKLKFDIRAHMDGDSTAMDWITEPLTRHRLLKMIDNIIKNIPIIYCSASN